MAPVQFGILLIPFQILDVAGPLDIVGSCSQAVLSLTSLGAPASLIASSIDIEFHYIGASLDTPVTASAGIKITPTTTYATCPRLDYLLIGGPEPAFFQTISPEMKAFVQARTKEVETLFTTCSGAMVAAACGVLEGMEATTNHGLVGMAREMFPGVKWTSERQWVVAGNGKFWTSGGASAGMDMFAHWVTERCGREVAEWAFAGLDYEPRDVRGETVVLQRYGHVKA